MEDGSKSAWFFGFLGGIINLLIMVALIVAIIMMTLRAINSPEGHDYTKYLTLIGVMLYFGILGIWILNFSYRLKYSYSMARASKFCFFLGLLSVNVFAVAAGVFGYIESKEKGLLNENVKINPLFK